MVRDRRLPEETLREVLAASLRILSGGELDEAAFEAAWIDAKEAIDDPPCPECGGVNWPRVDKPKAGSFDWWDSPGAYFACRACGHYLASGFAYPYIRQADPDYPLNGALPSKAERQERVHRTIEDYYRKRLAEREGADDDSE